MQVSKDNVGKWALILMVLITAFISLIQAIVNVVFNIIVSVSAGVAIPAQVVNMIINIVLEAIESCLSVGVILIFSFEGWLIKTIKFLAISVLGLLDVICAIVSLIPFIGAFAQSISEILGGLQVAILGDSAYRTVKSPA
jgi:hypothetical protein